MKCKKEIQNNNALILFSIRGDREKLGQALKILFLNIFYKNNTAFLESCGLDSS